MLNDKELNDIIAKEEPNYENQIQLEKLYQHADKGLVVFDVTPFKDRLLTVDLDNGVQLNTDEIKRFGGSFDGILITTSKSGKGHHAYVIMDKPIVNHGLLAVLGGGDARREFLSAENAGVRVQHQYCMYETPEEAVRVRSFLKQYDIVPIEVVRPTDEPRDLEAF